MCQLRYEPPAEPDVSQWGVGEEGGDYSAPPTDADALFLRGVRGPFIRTLADHILHGCVRVDVCALICVCV